MIFEEKIVKNPPKKYISASCCSVIPTLNTRYGEINGITLKPLNINKNDKVKALIDFFSKFVLNIFFRDIFFAWLTCASNFGRNLNIK